METASESRQEARMSPYSNEFLFPQVWVSHPLAWKSFLQPPLLVWTSSYPWASFSPFLWSSVSAFACKAWKMPLFSMHLVQGLWWGRGEILHLFMLDSHNEVNQGSTRTILFHPTTTASASSSEKSVLFDTLMFRIYALTSSKRSEAIDAVSSNT